MCCGSFHFLFNSRPKRRTPFANGSKQEFLFCSVEQRQMKCDWLFAFESAIKRHVTKVVGSKLGPIDICESDAAISFRATSMEYRVKHRKAKCREALQADFDAFDISEEFGFILEEPLVSSNSNLSYDRSRCWEMTELPILDMQRHFYPTFGTTFQLIVSV